MKHLINPNLPQNEVDCVAISESAGESIEKLNSFGIRTIVVKPCNLLPDGISSHADLQLFHSDSNNIFIHKENAHLFRTLKNYNLNVNFIEEQLNSNYPDDVRLNAKRIGNNIILNRKTISKKIIELTEKNNLNIVDVKQGYSGCSICVINENAIITDDIGIYSAAQFFLNDVTYIEKNSIRLYGYNYGFIGGCCGKIAENKIAFNGEVSSHSDYKKIADALSRNNCEAIELKKGILEDIGGIIPLIEI